MKKKWGVGVGVLPLGLEQEQEFKELELHIMFNVKVNKLNRRRFDYRLHTVLSVFIEANGIFAMDGHGAKLCP